MKLFASIATVLTLISAIQAQNSTTTITTTYPADGEKPVPKPEWLELIKNANITNAPVLKSNGDNGTFFLMNINSVSAKYYDDRTQCQWC